MGYRSSEFNSYGSRRGNHEVMVRGTFANVRLRNKLAPGTEGGVTRLLPQGEGMSIYDASVEYLKARGAVVHPGGQGVWVGVEPRLGGQGAEPAGHQVRDRGEL